MIRREESNSSSSSSKECFSPPSDTYGRTDGHEDKLERSSLTEYLALRLCKKKNDQNMYTENKNPRAGGRGGKLKPPPKMCLNFIPAIGCRRFLLFQTGDF